MCTNSEKMCRVFVASGVSGWTERWFVLDGKRVMYYNQKGDRHPRGTLELNAGSRLKKIPTKEHAFHVVSDRQVSFFDLFCRALRNGCFSIICGICCVLGNSCGFRILGALIRTSTASCAYIIDLLLCLSDGYWSFMK